MTTPQTLDGLEPCLPPLSEGPEHPQRSTRFGIDVDEDMTALMESLWTQGCLTDCSCQGTSDRPAFVSFTNLDDAITFFKAVVSATTHEDTALVHMLDHSETVPSWKVFFAADDIDRVTTVAVAG